MQSFRSLTGCRCSLPHCSRPESLHLVPMPIELCFLCTSVLELCNMQGQILEQIPDLSPQHCRRSQPHCHCNMQSSRGDFVWQALVAVLCMTFELHLVLIATSVHCSLLEATILQHAGSDPGGEHRPMSPALPAQQLPLHPFALIKASEPMQVCPLTGGYATHRTQLSRKRMVIVQKCFLATRTFFKGKYSARQIDTT